MTARLALWAAQIRGLGTTSADRLLFLPSPLGDLA